MILKKITCYVNDVYDIVVMFVISIFIFIVGCLIKWELNKLNDNLDKHIHDMIKNR